MTLWTEGYGSDLPYPGGVYRQQIPSHLDAACLIAGVAPPVESGMSFTYCELGCGVGDTALVVASAFPQATVWGFDFNPAHIAQGEARIRRSGLGNLILAERSFRDLAEASGDGLPPFDYVTAHGVWSWISGENRDHIVTFLDRHLRPGGIFSVSYNAMPHWAGTMGLQKLLLEASRLSAAGSEAGFRDALGVARRMVDAGASQLDAHQVARLEALLARGNVGYLTHEYLNDHWRPAFHADVAAALAPAKLRYVASAELLDNFPGTCFTPEQSAVVEALPPSLRQGAGDFFNKRPFRRDVYVKGPRKLAPRACEARLRAQTLVLTVPLRLAKREIEVPLGKATLSEAFYAPAMARLAERNSTVGDLLDAAVPGTTPATREIAAMLIGTRQVLPVEANPVPHGSGRGREINLARIADALAEGSEECWLVSQRTGSTVRAGLMEMLIYEAVAALDGGDTLSPPTVRAAVVALMAGRGMSFNEGVAGTAADAGTEVETFVAETLPIWRRLCLV